MLWLLYRRAILLYLPHRERKEDKDLGNLRPYGVATSHTLLGCNTPPVATQLKCWELTQVSALARLLLIHCTDHTLTAKAFPPLPCAELLTAWANASTSDKISCCWKVTSPESPVNYKAHDLKSGLKNSRKSCFVAGKKICSLNTKGCFTTATCLTHTWIKKRVWKRRKSESNNSHRSWRVVFSRRAVGIIFTKNAKRNYLPEWRGQAELYQSNHLCIACIQAIRRGCTNSQEKPCSMGKLRNHWRLKNQKEKKEINWTGYEDNKEGVRQAKSK